MDTLDGLGYEILAFAAWYHFRLHRLPYGPQDEVAGRLAVLAYTMVALSKVLKALTP